MQKETGMSKNPQTMGLLAIVLLTVLASALPAQTKYTPEQILGVRPKCDDAVSIISTPLPADRAKCNLEVKPGAGGGFFLKDGNGQLLRRFIDSDGDGPVDTWCFYKDGAEVYRETFTAKEGYSFRWIGHGGTKWGVGKGPKVESWLMISAEEATHEAFQALATGDYERLRILFITQQEIAALQLPPGESQKLNAQILAAPANFTKVRKAYPNLPKAKFSRLENAKPGAYPTDLTGGAKEIVKIPTGLISFENAAGDPKQYDWINSFEIIQVGNVWRLTDVPGPDAGGGGGGNVNPELAKALKEHEDHGAAPAPKTGKLGPWTLRHVTLVQRVAEYSKAEDQENWYKQIPDHLAFAVIDGDDACAAMLAKWKNDFAAKAPGGSLAAYATFREMWSQFQKVASKPNVPPKDYVEAQEKYHADLLTKFIPAYPKSEEAAAALYEVATGSEYGGKEDEAKKYYTQMVTNHPTSSNLVRARGALKRIDSVGKRFELDGPTMTGQNYRFVPGKVTVVYYWASYSQVGGDFVMLKKLQQMHGTDLDIVAVNLDEGIAQANAFLQKNPLTAVHLHQPNAGFNGPLATNYGILGLPHLFLLDRTGSVVSNKVQTNALDEEIAKLVKK
jgi:hypothetical protein